MPPSDEPSAPKPSWSRFGVGSAVLGAVCVAALALIAVLWVGHRGADADRTRQARVLQTAADWTGVLINMNVGNVAGSLETLRDGTVGDLNSGFEASISPYRKVVETLNSRTTGSVESVSIEVLHHDPDATPGQRPSGPQSLPAELTARTDTVLVVATSVSENTGGKPTTVHWNLRLGVSEVDGKMKVSRLESLR
ncbi:MAG: hypothetical protein ACOYBX_08515 [Mycobacterium sp.]